ncbi:MAG: 50S ribosomal protein L22 [bacterium]|nr:50S ribosomal protein L22 [bacterium]
MAYKYSMKTGEKNAKAVAVGLQISFKQSVEICSFIRGKKLSTGIAVLERVMKMKEAVPYKRFCKGGVGHKSGDLAAGRYPINASKEIIKVLKNVEANAQQKGLNTAGLVISVIKAQKGSKSWHYGRQRRRKMKRTHIEVFVEEKEVKAKKQPKVEKKAPEPVVKKPAVQKVTKQPVKAKEAKK